MLLPLVFLFHMPFVTSCVPGSSHAFFPPFFYVNHKLDSQVKASNCELNLSIRYQGQTRRRDSRSHIEEYMKNCF